MLEAVPLLVTTLVLVSVFAYSFALLQLEDIRHNWNDKRCEPLVMMMANMVPTDPTINSSDFSSDNFNFCITQLIDSSIAIFLAPMLTLFSKQVDATKPINDSMNYLKSMAASLLAPLYSLFDTLWRKFGYVIYHMARIFYKLHSAMDRVFSIAVASLFAGMSMYKAIQNAIGFTIQVIIAILIILVILVIFLYFVMWPVIPLILVMIGILSTTVYAANVSGMSGSFCVAGNTLVKMKSGWKPVSEVKAGDELDSGTVEGVLQVSGKGNGKDTCVSINDVIISKTHLLWLEAKGKWIFAGSHPNAKPVSSPEYLYCLNTTTHTWTVKQKNQELLLRDWEELPDGHDSEWDDLIYTLLNGVPRPSTSGQSNGGRGLLGENTVVWDKHGYPIRIADVKIGDTILDGRGYTRVIGVYSDAEAVPIAGPNTSIWYFAASTKHWIHPYPFYTNDYGSGKHLITESGTFYIDHFSFKVLVRDFTEVGADRIHETYSFVENYLP
jgi:hypothetical protein